MRHIHCLPRARRVLLAAALAGAHHRTEHAHPPPRRRRTRAPRTAEDAHRGKLTIGTDDPVYPPWFTDNKPQNGRASRARWPPPWRPRWLQPGRGHLGAGHLQQRDRAGPKKYDFDINEFSITEERKQAVDFSSPYYDVTQAVIALKSSKIAGRSRWPTSQGPSSARRSARRACGRSPRWSSRPPADGLQQQRRRQEGAGERSDRRSRGGPADRVLHDLGGDRQLADRGPAAAAVRHPEQFGLVLDKGSR
jgi:polar amino acid transport system substrate-binding protein